MGCALLLNPSNLEDLWPKVGHTWDHRQQLIPLWQLKGGGGGWDWDSAGLEQRFVSLHVPYQQCAIFGMALHNWSTLTRMIRWCERLCPQNVLRRLHLYIYRILNHFLFLFFFCGSDASSQPLSSAHISELLHHILLSLHQHIGFYYVGWIQSTHLHGVSLRCSWVWSAC